MNASAHLLRKSRTLLSVQYAYLMEYRSELVLWMLSGVLPFILMGVWVRAGAQGDFPLSAEQFARYFLAVFLVRQLTVVWVTWELEELIVQGRLSHYLLQPLNIFWRLLAMHVAERAARAPFLIALLALFFFLYPYAFWIPSPAALGLFLAAIIAAFITRYVLDYAVGLTGFWIERPTHVQTLVFGAMLFLSGVIAPLDVYPPAFRTFCELTPFPYLVYFPAQLLVDEPGIPIARGFAVLAAWTLAFTALAHLLWRRGLRQYSGMGA